MMTNANSDSAERSETTTIARVGSVAGSALHVDHGPLRRSFTRDELFKFAEKWIRANSLEIGCSRDYYHERLGLLISFTGDLFDGPNTTVSNAEPKS